MRAGIKYGQGIVFHVCVCVCVFIQKLHIRKHSAMFLQIFLHAQIFSRTPAATSRRPRQMPAAVRADGCL